MIPESPRTARLLGGFARRFGTAHLDFACHAAVPIALTPELAYELWSAFRVDAGEAPIGAPWIAVADLLLSELCSEIGPELYEIRPDLRKALVQRLKSNPRFGETRLREVAGFLLDAAEAGLRTRDPHLGSLAASQRWAALAYTAPERAAAMIAETLSELEAADPMAWVRMEAVLRDLEEPLSEHTALRSLASAMADFGRGKTGALQKHLSEHGQTISVAGRKVSIPAEAREQAMLPARRPQVAQQKAESPRIDPIARGPERRQRVDPRVAQAQSAAAEPSQTPAAEPSDSPRKLAVLVAGTGTPEVPMEVRIAAEHLGAALAKVGHTLLTCGWPGVDAIVAEAFVDALPEGADSERRLVQITSGGKRPVFKGGGWIQAPGNSDTEEALRRADVVVAIGGAGGTMEILRLADQMSKHVVPLRWTGGDARAFAPISRGHVPLCHARRVQPMLDVWTFRNVHAERLIARAMKVVELADSAKAEAFGRYNDALADLLLAVDPVIGVNDSPELQHYLADVREVATGEDLGTRLSTLALPRFAARAAEFSEWLMYDIARLSRMSTWDKHAEATRSLVQVAARHARPLIADDAAALYSNPAHSGMADQRREIEAAIRADSARVRDLLTAVRADFAEAKEADFQDSPYQIWLRPVVMAWAGALLTGNDPDFIASEVIRTLPEIAPFAEWRLADVRDRRERVAAYLWMQAFHGRLSRENATALLWKEIGEAQENEDVRGLAQLAQIPQVQTGRKGWGDLGLALSAACRVLDDRPSFDLDHALRDRLSHLVDQVRLPIERRICRIRGGYQDSGGAGFLIGPSHVLTTAATARKSTGMVYFQGGDSAGPLARMVSVARRAVARSGESDLAFEVFELAEPAGNDLMEDGSRRGWLPLAERVPDVGEPLLFPESLGRSSDRAAHEVLGRDGRILHCRGGVTSRSTGFPMLSLDAEVLALYEHHDPKKNESRGILSSAILQRLAELGKLDVLGG